MTRGKFVLITNKKVYISTEFNGDMYPKYHGKEAYSRLLKVKNLADLTKEVKDFNKKNFNYKEELINEQSLRWLKKTKNFNWRYFDNWFSDWLYIKNLSGEDITFILDKGQEEKLVAHGETVAFKFGRNPNKKEKDCLM